MLGEPLPAAAAASAYAVERIANDCVRYSFEAVRVSTRYGLIAEIAVSAGYAGTIDGAIGPGSTLAEVEAHCGGPSEPSGEPGRLVPRTPGWCFETTPRAAGDPPIAAGEAQVSVIMVFVPPDQGDSNSVR